MYFASIQGYRQIIAFSESEETAKKLAVKEKKRLCKDDLTKWNWETVSNYYGAYTREVKEGYIEEL